MFGLLSNTIEGVLGVATNTAKLVVSPILAPIDDGKAISDSVKGIEESFEKIGKS